MPDNLIVISAPITTFIIALLVPIVNGLLTKYTLPSWIKGIITLAMNTIAALVTTSMSDTGAAVLSKQTLYTTAIGFVVSVAMYSGVYKPANLTSSKLDGKLIPQSGIGG